MSSRHYFFHFFFSIHFCFILHSSYRKDLLLVNTNSTIVRGMKCTAGTKDKLLFFHPFLCIWSLSLSPSLPFHLSCLFFPSSLLFSLFSSFSSCLSFFLSLHSMEPLELGIGLAQLVVGIHAETIPERKYCLI